MTSIYPAVAAPEIARLYATATLAVAFGSGESDTAWSMEELTPDPAAATSTLVTPIGYVIPLVRYATSAPMAGDTDRIQVESTGTTYGLLSSHERADTLILTSSVTVRDAGWGAQTIREMAVMIGTQFHDGASPPALVATPTVGQTFLASRVLSPGRRGQPLLLHRFADESYTVNDNIVQTLAFPT